MSEFVNKNFKVYVVDGDNYVEGFSIGELLPYGFEF